MASKSTSPAPQDLMDFFPFRGQYGGSAVGASLFVAVRSLVPAVFYALLAPPKSSYSLFSKYSALSPSYPPPTRNIFPPLIPSAALNSISITLGLSPISTVVFLGATLPSFSFIAYNLLWRRERLPLTGQGGALQITTQVNLTDIMHGLLFVYTASRNPTWSPIILSFTPIVFLIGFVLHVTADHSKYLFRKDKRNKGKVLRSGVWGLVRHPNFLGFTIWRVAFATAAGGWGFGLLLLGGFCYLFANTSIPILEAYMEKSYGKEWDVTKKEVKWKMVPGIW